MTAACTLFSEKTCVEGTRSTVDRAESAREATAPVRPPETCRMSKCTVAPLGGRAVQIEE